ncbi:MAG TPA: hypothetical protein VF155_11435 [Candidatus Dormibacteraeota bacterium]
MDESSTSIRREERLAHGPAGDVWRVRAADGRVLVARQIIGATRGEHGQLRELIRRGRALGPPVVPFVEVTGSGGDVWLLREFQSGVPLSKLALSSPLNQRQAAGIADACLGALAQLHEAGLCHGRVHMGNVFIGPDGSIRLADGGIGGARTRRDLRAQQDADLRATAGMLHTAWPDAEYEAGRLVHERLEAGRMGDAAAAREGLELLAGSLPPADNKPLADFSLAVLSVRLFDDLGVLAPPASAAPQPETPKPETPRLTPGSTPLPLEAWLPDEPSLSQPQPADPPPAAHTPAAPPPPPPPAARPPVPLAAAALPPAEPLRATPPPPVVGPASPPALPLQPLRWQEPVVHNATARPGVPSRPPATHRLASGETLGERARQVLDRLPAGRARLQRARIGPALAVSVALALTFVAARAVASPSQHPSLTPSPAQAHSQPAAPSPAPGTAVLQPAAPASAGFVRQVQLLPAGACQPGGGCSLETMFNLQAPHDGGITWNVVAVDRCTGAQTVLSSSTSTPNPSWQVVWRTDRYSLPSTDPMLLYLVTVSPWRVASSPVAVGDANACAQRT